MDELGIIEQGVDWRTRVGQDIRDRMTDDILFSLQMKLQMTTSTTLIDLQKVATRIEERIYTIATDYGDYLRRISLTKGDLEDSYPMLLNNFLHIRQQASIHSSILLHQNNNQGILSNELTLNDHKKPFHPNAKDRISELPNDLFQHILSYLSTREAVRTGVLSQWWVNRWAFLQSIQLDVDWFHMDREKFSNFVDNLLVNRHHADVPMDTFQLHSFAIEHANCWINHAIKHNAKVLKFTEYQRWEPFYLDPKLVGFSSQYLKTLELTNAALYNLVFDPLNNACPALQNLILTDCLMEVEEISSSSLQKLDIIGCFLLKDLSICTPGLVSLRIKDRRMDNSSYKNSYLVFTNVTLIDASNVTSMELSAVDRKFTFVEKAGSSPMFRNLRSLHLSEWCIVDLFSPLRQFIQHSPMLEMVTLKLSLLRWRFQITDEHAKTLVRVRDARGLLLDFDWY
uniref:Mediator complex subunit 15 KIX domain-containing protein n=1 Tax=Oryza brachyantha TaxID=4533 RepID=J3MR37_ORYBR